MPEKRLFTSSNPLRGRSAAMQWAAERSSGLPHSVLYISPPEVRGETLVDQWAQYGSQLALQTTRFDSVVDTLYESDTHEGHSTYGSQAERQWVIESALSRIADETHPLYCDGEPSVGLVQQAENVLSLLEFAGLDSKAAVRERLIEVGVEHLAGPLAEFTATVHAVHDGAFARTTTFRGERYLHVLRQGNQLAASTHSEVDVVIIGAFQTLSPLERDLIGVLSSIFDTAIVSPRVTPETTPTGADAAVSRITSWYTDLGFTHQSTRETPGTERQTTSRSGVAACLYRYADRHTEHSLEREEDVTIETHATIRHEVAAVARRVRSLIAGGLEPDEICVAPFDLTTYTERIAQQLRAADVPVQHAVSRDFFSTTTGGLIDAALTLGAEPQRQEPLVRLLSNPFVQVDSEATETIVQYADRVESTRIDVLESHLEEPARAVIEAVVSACRSFVDSTDLSHGRLDLLRELAVPVDDHGLELTAETLSARVTHREESALGHLGRLCDSLSTVLPETDMVTLRRALEQVTIETTVGRQSNSVHVCTPTEAVTNPYTYVFVPGLTTEHTPSPPRRPAFARALNESHTDFEAADPIRRSRYLFALLLTSGAELWMSAPERNANGDQYVQADLLVELQRVADIDSDSSVDSHRDQHPQPATRGGVHRSVAMALDTGGVTPREITEHAGTYDIVVPDANTVTRLTNGIQLAAARAASQTGPYDGRIDPTVVDGLRNAERPFSPSQLETYAQCGFKYYMGYLLDIKVDETISLELDAGTAGTYIHGVFEGFYNEWTAQTDEAISEATMDEAEETLYAVAVDRLSDLDVTETVFHTTWLRSMFDGLAVDGNQYGNPEASDGLFRRFLDAEKELTARDAQPTYFEAHVGLTPDDGATVISQEPVTVPGTDVTIRGKIDRLDVTAGGDLVGFDYKTGSTPTESASIEGRAFQLPVYLLMAEDALGVDALGGSYYQVDPSSTVAYHSGTIGSEEHAAHARYGKDDSEPLRRERTLEFDTHAEFQEFLYGVVADRIEQISMAVDSGSFHPTVLDPSEAGCEHCAYRDACDVRHHRRHDIHTRLDGDGVPAYTPSSVKITQGEVDR